MERAFYTYDICFMIALVTFVHVLLHTRTLGMDVRLEKLKLPMFFSIDATVKLYLCVCAFFPSNLKKSAYKRLFS